jgi:hypothetical protein
MCSHAITPRIAHESVLGTSKQPFSDSTAFYVFSAGGVLHPGVTADGIMLHVQ